VTDSATTPQVELDGGTFAFTLPDHWTKWILFVLGGLLFIFGFVMSADPEFGGPVPAVSAIGCLLMLAACPTELAVKLAKIRAQMRPAAVKMRSDAGGVELESFWNSATVERPSHDDRDWVFPAPPEDDWHLDSRYAADADKELIPEHPNRVGTPRPPQFSNYGIFSALAFLLLLWQASLLDWGRRPMEACLGCDVSTTTSGPHLAFYLIGISVIWLGVSVFMWKRAQAMQDTPTSNIRSMAVGTLELVGQVRPWVEHPPTVAVDGDLSKSVDDLSAWYWKYEIYRCRKVHYTDSEGNRRTREECNWETIRSDSGATPFILHDGTGGVFISPESFSRSELGNHLVRWECRHDRRLKGLFTNLMFQGDVRRHRWTLWGLKLGDPCYLLGTAQSRKNAVLEREEVDRTVQNALLEVVGEDAPGFKARLERGTELTALSGVRSQIEYLIIPTLALVTSILTLSA